MCGGPEVYKKLFPYTAPEVSINRKNAILPKAVFDEAAKFRTFRKSEKELYRKLRFDAANPWYLYSSTYGNFFALAPNFRLGVLLSDHRHRAMLERMRTSADAYDRFKASFLWQDLGCFQYGNKVPKNILNDLNNSFTGRLSRFGLSLADFALADLSPKNPYGGGQYTGDIFPGYYDGYGFSNTYLHNLTVRELAESDPGFGSLFERTIGFDYFLRHSKLSEARSSKYSCSVERDPDLEAAMKRRAVVHTPIDPKEVCRKLADIVLKATQ